MKKLFEICLIIACFLALMKSTTRAADKYGCDFETPCTNLVLDRYWQLASANKSFAPDAPNHDHTFMNSSGHYVFFNITGNWPKHYHAIFKFNKIFNYTNLNQERCLQFYYIMNADQSKNMTVMLSMGDNGDLQPVWLTLNTFKNRSNDWTLGELRLPNDSYYIWFDLNYNDDPLPHVLLVMDDIFVTDQCHNQYETNSEESEERKKVLYWCDFERDDCGLENTLQLEWQRIEAKDRPYYGPKVDHTYGTEYGHYLITNSSQIYRGQAERVVTTTIEVPDDNQSYCLSFYYYLDSYEMLLYVTSIPLNASESAKNVTGKLNYQIWPPYGTLIKQKWSWAVANLLPGKFRLSFLMANLDSFSLRAAIDDIKIYACPAVNDPLTAYDPEVSYYFEFECDFETDRCGFTDTQDQAVYPSYWDRIDAHHNFYPSLGPPNDHTTGTADGHYLTVNFTLPLDFSATTSTVPLFMHRDMCLEFYYYMNSDVFSNSSQSTFDIMAMGFCFDDYLYTLSPFQNETTTAEWTRLVVRVDEFSCQDSFFFDFNLEDLFKMSVSVDDVRVDLCNRIDPPLTTTTTTTFSSSNSNP